MGTQFKKSPLKTTSKIRILRQINPYKYEVEVKVMRNGVNENRWDFQNIADYYKTFAGTPILIAYVNGSVGDGHNSDTKVDFKTGERYQSYTSATAERAVGYLSTEENDFRLEEDGGYTWLIAKGLIWTVYARELVDKIEAIGRMDVSAEINSIDEHENNGVIEITRWAGLGVTILGDHVAPAIPGSNIKKMAAYKEQLSEMKQYVASLEAQKKGNEPQKKTKKTGVKHSMSKNRTLAKVLAEKFPNFKVMAFSEDGSRVCLMSKENGDTFAYAFDEADNGAVVAEKIKPVMLSASVEIGGDALEVSADDIYAELTERNNSLATKLEKAEMDVKELSEKIDKMVATEKARRIEASKTAAKRQLAEINLNRDEDDQFEEDCINEVIEAAERGDFVECENADGQWTGEEKACSAVRDIAMQKQIALDKEKATKRNNSISKTYVFENSNDTKGKGDSLEALYSRMAKND